MLAPVRTGSTRQHRRTNSNTSQYSFSPPLPPAPCFCWWAAPKFINRATKALAACWEREGGVTRCENLGEDPGSPAHQGSTVEPPGYAQGMRRVCAGYAQSMRRGCFGLTRGGRPQTGRPRQSLGTKKLASRRLASRRLASNMTRGPNHTLTSPPPSRGMRTIGFEGLL